MLLHLLLVTLILPSYVVCNDSCAWENVSAAEGGDVILRVHQTRITFIHWIILPEGRILITTEPGKPLDEKKVITRYRGRVRSEDDGSLRISNLSLQDQRIYRADIRTVEDKETGVCFNLTVFEKLSPEDINISYSITRNDTCSISLSCTVGKQNVTTTWSNLNSSNVNVTQDVLHVPPSDVNHTYMCTARNPVSNASQTVTPGKYCKTGTEKMRQRLSILWALLFILLLCIIPVIYVKWKTRRRQKKEIPRDYIKVGDLQGLAENPCNQNQEEQSSKSIYSEVQHAKETQPNGTDALSGQPSNCSNATGAKGGRREKKVILPKNIQVGDLQRPVENPYNQNQREQSPASIYSEVQHAKKTTDSEKDMDTRDKKAVETLYSVIKSSQETQPNGTDATSAQPSNCAKGGKKKT